MGFGLSERAHLMLLVGAIGVSMVVSAWRSWTTRRVWPAAVATLGATLVAAGHVGGELPVVEWAGVLVLLAGGLFEHFRLRRRAPVGDRRTPHAA